MKNLKLDVEALRIEQFEVEHHHRTDQGTVMGHARHELEAPKCSILTNPTAPYQCPNMTSSEIRACNP
jgi:hypothetical protein